MNSGHLVLLGDSIFDNASYVAGGPDVIRQVRDRLAPGWRATLCARDGSTTANLQAQLDLVPADAGFLVVSAGGNDALGHAGILDLNARSSGELLDVLARAGDVFQADYARMLHRVVERKLPTAVCTIYHPRFPDVAVQRRAVAALATFNDAILREAFTAGIPVIDLRRICTEDADYANPIEPSVRGGAKIADAVVRVVTTHDFARRCTAVYPGRGE